MSDKFGDFMFSGIKSPNVGLLGFFDFGLLFLGPPSGLFESQLSGRTGGVPKPHLLAHHCNHDLLCESDLLALLGCFGECCGELFFALGQVPELTSKSGLLLSVLVSLGGDLLPPVSLVRSLKLDDL